MYEIFEQLLQEHGATTYLVAKETGLSQAVFSHWKTGRSVPKQDKLQKIANYFGVSVDYLMGGEKDTDFLLTDNEKKLVLEYRNCAAQDRAHIMRLLKYYNLFNKKSKEFTVNFVEQLYSSQLEYAEELRAAHNDFADDEEEIKKINRDFDKF